SYDCQTEAKPAVSSRPRTVSLSEAIENVRQSLFRYSLSGIAYSDQCVVTNLFKFDVDLSADGRKLDRIRQKIPEDWLQTLRIARNGIDMCLELVMKLDTLCFGHRLSSR